MDDYSTISNHCSIHCASSDYREVSLDLPSVPEYLRFGGEVGEVNIGKYVTIGSHSCVLPNTILPQGFACGAFSLIKSQKYEEFSLYTGIPAKFLLKRNKNKLNEIIKKK
jgi:acetyltransferase-like isoleucine patch superfamily enzyme